ncbi:TIGR00341 family protein [Arcobacter sp. CECT 8983]|uniref:TIGR00341 family protein n=1 Tax=Arcobacter sp. CECT 8983 TaxID=2044508 RepID=UPI00100ACB23|nr:TIGR00341 family protein [Arcobacter sp. CECT 8983]RXJ88878.1 TIGR00341 family protein [Arcobacter sp. CECT 8983]
MYKKIYLLFSENSKNAQDEINKYLKEKYKLNITARSYEKKIKEKDALYLLDLNDKEIKTFFEEHIENDINVAILPNDDAPNCMSNYGISKNLEEALDDALNEELLAKIDLLKCNDEIILNKIEIGDMHGINNSNLNTKFDKLKTFFKNLFNINFKSYKFTTSEDYSFETVASGIIILEHSLNSTNTALKDKLSIQDGKLNALILSPGSVVSYFFYLILIFFYEKITLVSRPKSLGFIKSKSLKIQSKASMDYIADDIVVKDVKTIEVLVLKDTFNLHLGNKLKEYIKDEENEEKEVIDVDNLPKEELSEVLLKKKLPFLKRASEDDFKDLFVTLKKSSEITFIFSTLMILSSLLSTTGLFANSSPVIIGAMILAPLMAPLISLSMGVIRANSLLIIQSAKTLSYGVFLALFVSSIFTCFMPLDEITYEMESRLHPNLLDLFVAIFSGIAGAYANSKEDVIKSLAGVAIAVALVPPLSVTGIGIGLMDLDIIYGAFLLFLTNLVGMTLSASLTFIVLGYAPIKKAKKGLIYTFLLLVLISVPLSNTFGKMVEKNELSNKIKEIKKVNINDKSIVLKLLDVENKKAYVYVRLELISNSYTSTLEYKEIKKRIEKKLDRNILLEVSSKLIVN